MRILHIFAYFAECVFDKPSILKSRAKIGSLESMCEDIAETKPTAEDLSARALMTPKKRKKYWQVFKKTEYAKSIYHT